MAQFQKGIPDISLRQLECFVAVADELQFVRAARRLGMAQPPVSRLIERLERSVGAPLFERGRRGVRLTPVGSAMLAPARRALIEARRAADAARRIAAGESGELSVGFSSSAVYSILPRLLRAYRERYPRVHLTLRELTTAQQLGELEAGTLEVAIGRVSETPASLTSRLVHREPFVAVLPLGHPLAAGATVSLKPLSTAGLIMFPREVAPAFHDRIFSAFRAVGTPPQVREEAAEWHTIVGLVGSGLGVAVAPASLRQLSWAGVEFRPLRDCAARAELFVVWPRDAASPLVKAFLEASPATV